MGACGGDAIAHEGCRTLLITCQPSHSFLICILYCRRIQGRALLEVLEKHEEWQDVIAISRRPLTDIKTRAQHLRLDLTDKPAVSKVGSSMKDSSLSTPCYAHSATAPGRHTQSHCLTNIAPVL